MRRIYLAAAIVGAIAPYYFFIRYFLESGVGGFVGQLFATAPAGGFTTDLLITSAVFWVWSHAEARALGMQRWWAYVAVNLLIGLSCAFPLFLYFRAGKAAVEA